MTPQKKAKELIEKFLPFCDYEIGKIYQQKDNAKQCALIAVDEIMNFMEMDDIHNQDCHMANTHWPQYWVTVKQEIEKL